MKKKKRKSKGRKEEKQKTDSQHIIEKKISNGNANKVNIIQYIGKEALKSKNKIISNIKSLINNKNQTKSDSSKQPTQILKHLTTDDIKKKMEIVEMEIEEKQDEEVEDLWKLWSKITGKTKTHALKNRMNSGKTETTNKKQTRTREPIWINYAQQNKNNSSNKTITSTNQSQYELEPTRYTSELCNQESDMESPYNSTMNENEDEIMYEKINEIEHSYVTAAIKYSISKSIKHMEIAELLMR
jgi:hypothetical protein